jgi:CheY-like chemotaxis protein
MTRKMIMKDLNDSGLAEFEFIEAGDGVEALEQYQPDKYDIIFVDFQMPRKDGTEFLNDLHNQHDQYPPAVMITSERSMEVLEKAADAGVQTFMLKPVDKDRLRKGLRKLIDSLPERNGNGSGTIPYGRYVPESLSEMLAQMAGLELTPEPENEAVRHGEIVFGTIAIMGGVHWSVTLGFEAQAASRIAEGFTGMEIPPDSPDMGDAVGELVNIVAGEIKRKLEASDMEVEISLPVVNAASKIRTIAQRSTTIEHQHFDSPAGKMWTSVTVGMNPGLVL